MWANEKYTHRVEGTLVDTPAGVEDVTKVSHPRAAATGNAGYFGDLMSTSAMARQVGGLAIDGCVRDSAEIIEMGFPIFCRGTCMRGTVKKTLGFVNHPVLFGDVVVNPGDLVLGDDVTRALRKEPKYYLWAQINELA